jgi:hypothetical protein
MMPKYPKICLDRVLPRDLNRPQRLLTIGGRLRAVLEFRKMWINGTKLSVRFMEGNANQHAIVKEQAEWWTKHANLDFEFNNAPDADVRITFDPRDGAWSYVGTDCKNIPQNEPTMNLGFLDGGTAAHEFGHAIGLGHEHQNPDGGIQWNRQAVIDDLTGPPNSWTIPQIEHNVLEKYTHDQINGTEFDPDSIMLYAFPASWTVGGEGTDANEVLSDLDKDFIKSADAYPGRGEPVPRAVELAIGAVAVEAKIGVPGEEDLFKFIVEDRSRHIVETGGETDVVMKLFGPGSQTHLIAEDDDGGWGLNARITADLTPGEYLVQVRHYNKTRGTGRYRIRVAT